MAVNDLDAPLGQTKARRLPRFPLNTSQVLAGLLGLFAAVVLGWIIFGNDPLGGEPRVVVATKGLTGAKPGANSGNRQHARHDGDAGSSPPAAAPAITIKTAPPPGSKTVTIIDGSSGERHDVVIPGKAGETAKTPVDQKLLETTRHGLVPKVGADGTRSLSYYAHPRAIPPDKKDWPRIAIVVGGLGISAHGTTDALAKLPGPVSLAIAPYGTGLEQVAEQARAKDHELLLQAPMEPFDYPNNDPGPQTLLTSLAPEQDIDRLHWLMSRFQGYVGIISYMGAKFTASEQALAPVLRETAKRGLIYVDDGASSRSVASQIAGAHSLPFAKTDIVVDAMPTPSEIDHALTRLELAARERGAAVGFANALPGTIARIAAWAKKVESRGFVLVPITMVAVKASS